ncbi:NACHT domain-containing protein [Cryptosporangium aurantiacum]|uniref:NACHT domain-containing protein n=1 Tax=Cryptosporangium aurantiacum TaxID=134849 RepID=UPI0011611DB7|nr:hypothetical protein [Cryptosporangium aurantiacum]
MRGTVEPASVVGLLLASVTFAYDTASFLRQQPGGASRPVAALADDLARTVEKEWLSESRARGLRDHGVLPLSWMTERTADGPEGAAVTLRLSGRLDGDFDAAVQRMAESFDQLAGRRMVLVGEPGSGKTVLAILLTLGIVKSRPEGGPVPVLLSASSWDPIATPKLDEWVAQAVADTYYGFKREAIDALLAENLVIPVIDGLDEMRESGRRTAVQRTNESIRQGRGVVLTCRAAEYADLIAGGSPTLHQAPVVRVEPVAVEDVIRYLQDVPWPPEVSWDDVYAELRANPQSPVGQMMSTPLMVSLARSVYQRLGGRPADLLKQHVYESRYDVEDYVLDQVIEAAYAEAPAPDETGPRFYRPPDVAKATRWLTYLAVDLHLHGQRDLVWWQLAQRLLSPWVPPVVSVAAGMFLMALVSAGISVLDGDHRVGLVATIAISAGTGAGFSVLFLVVWFASGTPSPRRILVNRHGAFARCRDAFLTGLAAAR